MQMLKYERVDVGIIPHSADHYLMNANDWNQDFSYSMHHRFDRRFLIRSQNASLTAWISACVREMFDDEEWQRIMVGYGLQPGEFDRTESLEALSE